MNPIIKEKWIAALQSGNYEQGIAHLRYGNKFCCLGVLCDIHAKETQLGRWEEDAYIVGLEKSRLVLPFSVADWGGLEDGNPDIKKRIINQNFGSAACVAELNDHGMDFVEIARVIEEEIPCTVG